MIKTVCFIITGLSLLYCERSTTSNRDNTQQEENDSSAIDPQNFFTLANAEKILGQQAHLSDSASIVEAEVSTFKCSFTANAEDEKTGKTGNIYLMLEQYAQVSSAQKVYSSIKASNADHAGVKELHDLGDEAYFHSDGENFLFILARKGERLLRMKVNKITSTTSVSEFNQLAAEIFDHL
ncbi:MAG TPA: hypothetical protein VI603_11000 [Saprospiraceae bacterium]|nr:hypothetical protein [Saprospiraceae bacterium]